MERGRKKERKVYLVGTYSAQAPHRLGGLKGSSGGWKPKIPVPVQWGAGEGLPGVQTAALLCPHTVDRALGSRPL